MPGPSLAIACSVIEVAHQELLKEIFKEFFFRINRNVDPLEAAERFDSSVRALLRVRIEADKILGQLKINEGILS